MTLRQRLLELTPIAAAVFALPAWATNGMDMEGYGPISTGMGGASQAIDHGTAAMAQNPATLALMPSVARLDLAVGVLGPDVNSSVPGASAKSSGTSYAMPAFGYARRTGSLTYGLGVFAQGGMGTDYDASSFLAMGSGQGVRSELGVGRVLFPIAFQVNPNFAVGATLDYVWAGLDMKMAASGAQLGGLVTGASGNLAMALPALGGAPWARIDFSDNNDFTGAAKGTGWAGKLGFVAKLGGGVAVGGSYQTKTSLGDLKTGTTVASMSATGGFTDSGRITVVDFQWPETYALGLSWQASPAITVAADIKDIAWSGVMKDFKLRYDSAVMGGSVSFALPQNWKDQTVFNLGMGWALSPSLTLRAGVNLANDPIPAAYVHPLFPATVKNHYTTGFGWQVSPQSAINGSLTFAPKVSVVDGSGITVTHSQLNWQAMYSHTF